MRNRVFPPLAIGLIILLLGSPVHAGPVVVSNVVQVLTGYQNPPDLRLRGISQTPSPLAYGIVDSGLIGDGQQSAKKEAPTKSSQVIEVSDSLLAGTAVDTGSQPLGVQIAEDIDVEGTICDCGEILVPGGVPKWPLIFLGAIPFFFIHGDDGTPPPPTPPNNISTPTPTPTPAPTVTPTPTPVPEPASLLLFGTGIVAAGTFLRRRYFIGTDRQDPRDGGGASR